MVLDESMIGAHPLPGPQPHRHRTSRTLPGGFEHGFCASAEVPMHPQQAEGWTRRRFLGGLTVAGTVALVGQHARAVADPSSSVIQEVAGAGMESHAPPLDGPGDDHVASTAHFTLHSHPWVNLPHFLYQWARLEAARPTQRWPPSVDVPERGHIDALPAPHQLPWQAA